MGTPIYPRLKPTNMNIRERILSLTTEITHYRRLLHQHPQTAYEEYFANEFIRQKLEEWRIPHISGIAKTGVVATILGKQSNSQKALGFRADIDALPIQELNNFAWKSKYQGKMHACGHDGHTAILLGLAKHLNETRDFNGIVHLIFQPAEEGYRGANQMLEAGLFEQFPCDYVFGMHNWPTLSLGQFGLRNGPFMAAGGSFDIVIHGKGAHAAMPHLSVDSILIGSQIVTSLQHLASRTTRPVDAFTLSITNFYAGSGAYNIMPDDAKLRGTIRFFAPNDWESITSQVRQICDGIASAYGATVTASFDFIYDSVINDERAFSICAEVGKDFIGQSNIFTNYPPTMISEDFGSLLHHCPGCYLLMGQASKAPNTSSSHQELHTPYYDFNDHLIPIAIEFWTRIIEKQLTL